MVLPSVFRVTLCRDVQVAAAIVVTLHKGREASALAAAFNVLSLPAVVYLPPNCIAAVADECRYGEDRIRGLGHEKVRRRVGLRQ